ncbi:MAG TPA: hypothetical protein VH763_12565 [Gemmatimonadales bacterium]|jgi:hypothetical protein
MHDDDELDDRLKRGAAEYHKPPETPREAMWEAIQRRRQGEPSSEPGRVLAFPRRWVPWAAAAAAVLAVGIGIGRLTVSHPPKATPAVASAPEAPRKRETAYQLATVEHLGQAEAFLTLFRASVRSGGDEQLASATARQLLANNRLLLDSPAGQDRKTRLLLEDLELVLAEISQLSSEPRSGDLQMIREGIERGGVLSRLRTVVPAGATSRQGAL